MYKQLLLTSCLLLGSLTFFTACNNQEAEKKGETPPLPTVSVNVEELKELTAPSRLEVVGTLEAIERASISARIPGQIVELPVVLGSKVKQGDLLVKISAGEISAKVLQAEAQLSQARRNLTRESKLQKQGASTEETVKSLLDATRIAEAAFKEARTMLDYTTISAPFSGTVTKKIANTGDLASPGMVLLMIENGDALQVLAQVPESLLLTVQQGDTVPVTIPAASLTIEGVVAEVAPAANPLSRTAPVKINIPSSPDLRVGQFARIGLSGNDEKTIMLTRSAVLSKGQMDIVFVYDGLTKKAHMRLVRTGAVHGGQVEILSGLEPGEQVVVSSVERLQDGQPLAIQ
jgi:membrane fusion protein, multidrug efflux system